jgi:hypothetical protein
MRIADTIELDLRGTIVNVDGVYDCRRNRKATFNRGMGPNINANPRGRKSAKRGRTSFSSLPRPKGHQIPTSSSNVMAFRVQPYRAVSISSLLVPATKTAFPAVSGFALIYVRPRNGIVRFLRRVSNLFLCTTSTSAISLSLVRACVVADRHERVPLPQVSAIHCGPKHDTHPRAHNPRAVLDEAHARP